MPEKIKIKRPHFVHFVSEDVYKDHFNKHDRFTVVAHYSKRLRLFKNDQDRAEHNGSWVKSDDAWSDGVLIVQETPHMTVLLDRMHIQTFYYHDNHHDNLKTYRNRPLQVELATIIHKNRHTYVVLTRRPILTDIYNKLIEDNKPFKAKIVKFTNFGAYLKYDDLRIRIKNDCFSINRNIGLKDIYKVGDEIEVMPYKHNDKNVDLLVRTVKAFNFDSSKYWSTLKNGQIIKGKIRTWSPTRCYVRIAPGVDGMCKYPDFEIETDTPVLFKIAHVDAVEKKLRGYVIKPLSSYSEEVGQHIVQPTKEQIPELMDKTQNRIKDNPDATVENLTNDYFADIKKLKSEDKE